MTAERKAAGRALALVVLLAAGSPLGAQIQTPRERAEGLTRRARAAATDGERARLSFLALAEWYEEGARAVLALDLGRLEHAARQEPLALLAAYQWHMKCHPTGVLFVLVSKSVASELAYAVGQWHAHGRGPLTNQADLANLLFGGAERMRENSELC